jgi:hypothetical protein
MKYITTTTDRTGYPRNEDIATIDFQNFEEAEEYNAGFEGQICLFMRKAGWSHWINIGRQYEPLTPSDLIRDLGDNYRVADDTDREMYAEAFHDPEMASEEHLRHSADIIEAIDSNPDKAVIIGWDGLYDVVPQEMMNYEVDVWTYAIGVAPKD